MTDFGKPVFKITPCSKETGMDELFKDLRAKAHISRRAAIEDTSDEWSQQ